MSDQPIADELRRGWREAGSFSERAFLYMQLLQHPECRWRDLLEGLSVQGLIAESAAMELHAKLGVPARDGPCYDATYWTRTMESAGIDSNATVSSV